MEPFHMFILDLEGPPRARGRAHGEALRPQIQAVRAWLDEAVRHERGEDIDALAETFIGQTRLLQAAERWTPDLVAEVRGLAEGAGVGFYFLMTWQLQDESIWFGAERAWQTRLANADRCTGLAFAPDPARQQPALVAQNLDTPAWLNGYQTLLRIRYPASDLQSLVVTEAGLVGICGLNSRGTAVCQNTLAIQLKHAPDGLGAMLVARGLIDQGPFEAAINFLHAIPHASGENFIIGGPEQVVDYECAPGGPVRYAPETGEQVALHTNHPLANDERLADMPPEQAGWVEANARNSHARWAALADQVSRLEHPVTVDQVKTILSSHVSPDYPICRHKPPGRGSDDQQHDHYGPVGPARNAPDVGPALPIGVSDVLFLRWRYAPNDHLAAGPHRGPCTGAWPGTR